MATSTSIDDRDPSLVYNPAWDTGEQDDLYDTTDSFSGIQGASVTLHFRGTGVEYWGNYYNTHGPCAINLDGTSYAPVTAFATTRGDPQILWSISNLVNTDHTLTITVQSSATINRCELDRFVVHVAPTSSTPAVIPQTTTRTTSSTTSSHPSTSNTGSTTATSSTSVTSTGNSSTGGSSGSNSHSSTTSLITAGVVITLPNGSVETTTMPVVTSVADVSTRPATAVPAGTIVGAVIGSVALLLFILLFWLWYRRSNRREVPDLDSFYHEANHSSITPLRLSSKGERTEPTDSSSYSGGSSVRRLAETVAPSQSVGHRSSLISEEPPEEVTFHMPPPAYER